jgi:voltage-gated potassium channel
MRAPMPTEFKQPLVQRLRVPILALVFTHVVGTCGYRWLWRDVGGTWLDALFMTFTTITTIGFGEVKPLDATGRVLTMFVALSGIGSLFYSFTVLLDFITSGEARAARRKRTMQKSIDAMTDHYIVAGFGRVGREAASELKDAGRDFVVIDPDERIDEECTTIGCAFVKGDAADDGVLERAGIRRAKGLIVTTSSDAANLYVVLSARLLNPQIFIAARVDDDGAVPKLLRAGADRAINPYATGGRRLAHLMLSPRAVDFFETALKRGSKQLNIDDILVVPQSTAVGRTLAALDLGQRTGATVLAVLRSGTPTTNPHGDFVLAAGDHLLALGTDEQLQKLESVLAT